MKLTFFPLANDLDVRIDKEQMARVVSILFANSVRFSPSECRVKVFVEGQGDSAIVRISDTGIGIPEEALPIAFEPLEGEDGEESVNLYLVKEIVTAHGGTVTANNGPAGGTVFTICLPLYLDVIEEAVLMDEE
jgi:signal transduction histidine kinase